VNRIPQRYLCIILLLWTYFTSVSCQDETSSEGKVPSPDTFYYGADLSFVNQITDHGGAYHDRGVVTDPFVIFPRYNTNLIRLRLWHHPEWTQTVYGEEGTQLYSDLADVEKSIIAAKAQGLSVLLDFHYSDTWADPGHQEAPAAWKDISNMEVLEDSVYEYTRNVLQRLKNKSLLPEFIQVGNEINCGLFYTNRPSGFPSCHACEGDWENLGRVLNVAIRAVRDVATDSPTPPRVILHVADPKNIMWWFDNITTAGKVSDFDIIGISYYPLWHTTVKLSQLSKQVRSFRQAFNKEVMIVETAYPWTTAYADDYTNAFGNLPPLASYPFTPAGQRAFFRDLSRAVYAGGGQGIIYWEPAWITSAMKDPWGTGSSWENCTFFDFDGNTHEGITFAVNEH
jgi:arabinogalactan endo-1,4-beta-galactosidase